MWSLVFALWEGLVGESSRVRDPGGEGGGEGKVRSRRRRGASGEL